MMLDIQLCKMGNIYWDNFPWLGNIESIYCITRNEWNAYVSETKCSLAHGSQRASCDWEQLTQHGV